MNSKLAALITLSIMLLAIVPVSATTQAEQYEEDYGTDDGMYEMPIDESVPKGPDLTITSAQFSEPAPKASNNAVFYITVANNGNKPSTVTRVKVVDSKTGAGYAASVPALNAGQTKQVQVSMAIIPGTTTMNIQVDDQSQVAELNENNNHFSKSIYVLNDNSNDNDAATKQTLRKFFNLDYNLDIYIVSDPNYLNRKISWNDPTYAKTTFSGDTITVKFEDYYDNDFNDVVLEISLNKIEGGDHFIVKKVSSSTAARDVTFMTVDFKSGEQGYVSDFAEGKTYGGDPLTVKLWEDHRAPYTGSEEREYYIRTYTTDDDSDDDPDDGVIINPERLPDLYVYSAQKQGTGSTGSIKLSIKNGGDANAASSQIRVLYNDAEHGYPDIDKDYFQSLYAVGEYKASVVPISAGRTVFLETPAFDLSKSKSFTVKIDYGNTIDESSESNNIYKFTLPAYTDYVPPVTAKPDLVISNAYFEKIDDETGIINVRVSNKGRAAAGESTLKIIYIKANAHDQVDYPTQNADESSMTPYKTFVKYFPIRQLGDNGMVGEVSVETDPIDYTDGLKIVAIADYYDVVDESNEWNNQMKFAVEPSADEDDDDVIVVEPVTPSGDIKIRISPADQTAGPGDSISYSVVLQNDIKKCKSDKKCVNVPTKFKLYVSNMPYLTEMPSAIIVQPGESEIIKLRIQVPDDAEKNTIPFKIIAVDDSYGFYSKSAAALLKVRLDEDIVPPDFPDAELFSIELERGWNLVGLPGKLIRFEKLESNQKLIAFVYLKDKKEYVTMQKAKEYLGSKFAEYLADNAFWIYSYSDQTMTVSVDQSYDESIKIWSGWNLIPVRPDFMGDSLNTVKNGCDLTSTYLWDVDGQKWKKIYDGYVFGSDDVYSGFVAKSDSYCSFAEEITVPDFPEEEEEIELESQLWYINNGGFRAKIYEGDEVNYVKNGLKYEIILWDTVLPNNAEFKVNGRYIGAMDTGDEYRFDRYLTIHLDSVSRFNGKNYVYITGEIGNPAVESLEKPDLAISVVMPQIFDKRDDLIFDAYNSGEEDAKNVEWKVVFSEPVIVSGSSPVTTSSKKVQFFSGSIKLIEGFNRHYIFTKTDIPDFSFVDNTKSHYMTLSIDPYDKISEDHERNNVMTIKFTPMPSVSSDKFNYKVEVMREPLEAVPVDEDVEDLQDAGTLPIMTYYAGGDETYNNAWLVVGQTGRFKDLNGADFEVVPMKFDPTDGQQWVIWKVNGEFSTQVEMGETYKYAAGLEITPLGANEAYEQGSRIGFTITNPDAPDNSGGGGSSPVFSKGGSIPVSN
ncbi:hypothetical protein JW868_03045 [Candidatus Woesearchaeota archaeon]|nr:hypothetical protein [Candidatus Woesearchaeota archaeon]